MDEFKWRPEDACQINNEPKVRVAKFGNGYEQRAKDGINNQLKTYNRHSSNRFLSDVK